MPCLTRNIWKLALALGVLSFISVLVVWLPVAAAEARPGVIAHAVSEAVDATPTVDLTVTALAKEQLILQNKQLQQSEDRGFDAWLWSNAAAIIASLLSTLVVVIGALIGFRQWRTNRNDTLTKELKSQVEERFKTAVTALGSDNEGTQVGGAILLRSFVDKDDKSYEGYYTQVFDLAVAYLRLPISAHSPEDPDGLSLLPEQSDTPQPLTTLRQALIVVFKEAFPLARGQNKKKIKGSGTLQDVMQLQDASRIQLDCAYLSGADLSEAWMPEASLRGAKFEWTDLKKAKLGGTQLYQAQLMEADLRGADLRGASLREANLSRADLHGTYLRGADLHGADLSGAKLNWTPFESSGTGDDRDFLEGADLRGVKGLTKKQLLVCKAKGAIVDEDTMTSSPQPPVPPTASTQQSS